MSSGFSSKSSENGEGTAATDSSSTLMSSARGADGAGATEAAAIGSGLLLNVSL